MQQDFDPRDLEPALTSEEPGGGRGKFLPAVVAVVALVGFGGIVWYAYDKGSEQVAGDAAPLIKADASPIKTRPNDPGGMAVPNRDSLLLNQGGADAPRVERILPQPEQPVPLKPVETAAAPVQAPAPSMPSITGPRPAAPAQAAMTPPASPVPAQQAALKPAAPVPAPAAQTSPAPAPQPVALAPAKPVAPPPAAAPKPVAATSAPAVPSTASATPPVAAAAAGGKGPKVQLGSVKSEEAAQAEWNKLRRQFPELASLSLVTSKVDIAGKGTYVRVQAGPLADAAAASELCGTLKAKKQDCIIVR